MSSVKIDYNSSQIFATSLEPVTPTVTTVDVTFLVMQVNGALSLEYTNYIGVIWHNSSHSCVLESTGWDKDVGLGRSTASAHTRLVE